ncbi:ATP-binding protein (plasmid) [Nonomuraea sp. NBC_00507]|uniref:ATP-binding protein n=1 Tax=Nonomuraea sp. NBC_00507 TaxID=2976002 RepID=UPI002E189EB3
MPSATALTGTLPGDSRLAVEDCESLLAYVRATVAADQRHEARPAEYLVEFLEARGLSIPDDASPDEVLADLSMTTRRRTREKSFPGLPSQVHRVRTFLADVLADCPCAEWAVLLGSELAGNAVRHSASALEGGTFTVRCEYVPSRWVQVSVIDQGELPEGHSALTGWAPAEHGRGLSIVRAVATVSGTEYTEGATRSWFRLVLPVAVPGQSGDP